jgi:hypothetical protein
MSSRSQGTQGRLTCEDLVLPRKQDKRKSISWYIWLLAGIYHDDISVWSGRLDEIMSLLLVYYSSKFISPVHVYDVNLLS